LLLLEGKAVSLLLDTAFLLLALLGRSEEVPESRARGLLGDGSGRCSCEDLRLTCRWLKLGLKCKLELKIVEDDQFKLLPDGSGMSKLEP
jgi:hypothetical protein